MSKPIMQCVLLTLVVLSLVTFPGRATAQPGGADAGVYFPLVLHDKCMVARPLSLFGAQLYGVSGAGTP